MNVKSKYNWSNSHYIGEKVICDGTLYEIVQILPVKSTKSKTLYYDWRNCKYVLREQNDGCKFLYNVKEQEFSIQQ